MHIAMKLKFKCWYITDYAVWLVTQRSVRNVNESIAIIFAFIIIIIIIIAIGAASWQQ